MKLHRLFALAPALVLLASCITSNQTGTTTHQTVAVRNTTSRPLPVIIATMSPEPPILATSGEEIPAGGTRELPVVMHGGNGSMQSMGTLVMGGRGYELPADFRALAESTSVPGPVGSAEYRSKNNVTLSVPDRAWKLTPLPD